MPTSNETLVRVDGFWKIIPRVRPGKRWCSSCACWRGFSSSARSRTSSSSLLLQSATRVNERPLRLSATATILSILRPDPGARVAGERILEHVDVRDQRLAGEGECGLDLRAHRALRELREQRFDVLAGELADLFLLLGPEVAIDGRYLGEDDQAHRVEFAREQGRGSILVDHRVHSGQAALASHDRDAAPAARDRDRPCAGEPADGVELHDLEWRGRR